MKRRYFPGLNALRFFAATLVIFHHLEQYKFWSQKDSFWGSALIDALGHKPVGLFFVLSGFLITHLLLEEKRNTRSINIQQFYIKRVLRIWPLYFVIVLVALILIPIISKHSFSEIPIPDSPLIFISLVLILPNLLRISFPTLLGGNQLWSVGIEEQFYLFWPFLVTKYAHNISRFLVSFIVIKCSIHAILLIGLQLYDAAWLVKLEILYALFPIEQMAIGGLGATFLFHKNVKMLRIIGSQLALIVTAALILASSFIHIDFFLSPLLESVLFLILIYQITTKEIIHKYLENKYLNYLGSISYGIYMWHTLAITISITTMDMMNLSNSLFLCIMSVSLTMVFSYFSYKYMERPIIGLRKYSIRFSKHPKLVIQSNAK